MKKILFLLLGLTIAVGATAGVDTWNQKHDAIMQKRHPASEQRFKSHNMQHKATKPTKLRGETPVAITEQPEGTLVTYQRSGDCTGTYANPFSQSGNVMVVYDPDGTTVYVKGLACGVYYSAWVTGTIANGKITIPLGQYVWTYYEDGEYWYGLYLAWGSIVKNQDTERFEFTPDPDVTEVTYTIDGDNIILDNSNGGDNGDGATGLVSFWDDEDYFYYMEWGTVFTPHEITIPTTEIITEQPEGELVTYSRETGRLNPYNSPYYASGEPVDVVYAPDDETVYIKDIIGEYEFNTWVRGTISGGKIHVPLGQFIYFDLVDGCAYLDWGSTATAPANEDGINFTFTPDPTATEVTFTIDGDNLIMDNSTGGNDGDGATGLAMMIVDYVYPFFVMDYNTFLSPYVEPTVIEDQPEGELVTYQRSGYYFSGNYRTQGGEVNIVYAPDGETVYIQDILCYSGIGSWVMGTIENGKIHVPMKQYLTWNGPKKGGDGWGYMLAFGQTYYDEDYNEYMFNYDPSITETTFTINGNVISLDGTSFGPNNDMDGATGLVAVYSDDPSYFAQCDINTVFTIPSPMIDEQPEGELVTYSRSGYQVSWDGDVYEQDGTANIVYAPDGETVYIQDIINNGYGTWVRGTIEGDKIHVPTGQTIAIYNYNKAPTKARAIPGNRGGTEYIVLTAGQVVPDPDYDGGYILDYDPSVTEITFSIDGDNISLDNTSFGPNGCADGAMVIAASYLSAPQYFDICDLLTIFGEPQAVPTVIIEQPEGELVTYSRSGYLFGWDGEVSQQDGTAKIVYDADGETVYIQNIIYNGPGTWVRGTISDGKIHVPTGQAIAIFSYPDPTNKRAIPGNKGGTEYIVLTAGQVVEDPNYAGEYILDYDPSVTEITFSIDGETISLDNTGFGPNGGADGAMVIAASYHSAPQYFEQCDLLTVFGEPQATPTVITQQPAGTLQKYFHSTRSCDYGTNAFPYVYGEVEMVYSETSNTVYIKDLITGCEYGSWVKGTIDGNKIHVPTGQYLQYKEDYGYYTKLYWIKEEPIYEWIDGHAVETGTSYVPDYDRTEVTYTINGDVITMDDHYPSDNNLGIGAYSFSLSGDRRGYNGWDFTSKFMPYFEPTVLEDMPEGTLVTYNRRGNTMGHMDELMKGTYDYPCYWPYQLSRQWDESYVVYAPDGRTVYLFEPVQCRSNMHESRYTWVAGTLSEDGHKIIVPLEQYVNWNSRTNLAERLAWGTTHYRKNSNDEYEIYFVPDNSVMTVTYSLNDDGSISMDNSSGTHAQPTNYEYWSEPTWAEGNTGLAITDQFLQWRGDLNWTTTYAGDHPAVPMDPVVTEWEDGENENGNSALLTYFEPTDVDGFAINEEGLSYSIYTDNGKLFTFEASKYGLDEDVTEVTYDMWQDNWRLYPDCIYFYRTNAEGFEPFFNWRIGIQLHYTCNGVKQSSNIVYLEVFEKPDEPAVPGDVNGDGKASITDVTALISMLLSGSEFTPECDVNGDGRVSIADVTALINMLLTSN